MFEASVSRIGNLSFQQLLQRLVNLSPCENKVFFVEISFPDIHDDTDAISVCSGLQFQSEAHGSLRTVLKQFSVNAKDLCDIALYQHSQYVAFDLPNKTDVIIITSGKSVTRVI